MKSLGLATFGFGPAAFRNMSPEENRSEAYHFLIRYDHEVDDNYSLASESNILFDQEGGAWVSAGLGCKAFTGGPKVSGFAGAALGLGFLHSRGSVNHNRFGFTGSINAGVQFFRSSDVHMEFALSHLVAQKSFYSGLPQATSLTLSMSLPTSYL